MWGCQRISNKTSKNTTTAIFISNFFTLKKLLLLLLFVFICVWIRISFWEFEFQCVAVCKNARQLNRLLTTLKKKQAILISCLGVNINFDKTTSDVVVIILQIMIGMFNSIYLLLLNCSYRLQKNYALLAIFGWKMFMILMLG